MRVGIVCPYNIFKGGGVQECVIALQAELQKRGHDVKVITPLPRENGGHQRENTIFIGRSTDVKSPFATTAQVSITLDNEAIDRALGSEKFDVLHFHEPWVPMVSMQILSRSTSVNLATFHAKLPETALSRTIEKVVTPYTRSIMKYLHGLTAVSDAAAEYVRSLTDQPVSIIPNGIDLGKYRVTKARPHDSNKRILYIGRLERRKGVKYLIKAYAVLAEKDKNIQLMIAGDGPDRTKLEQFVREQQIDNVHFLGYISEAKKLRLLAEANLFVSPALFGESFGIVLLEAMAAGVPAIAGNNAGYTSVMRGTGELSVVNPKDTLEFARRMGVFLNDQGLRDVWQAWARQYVSQYSYPMIVDQYEDLYKKLLPGN